ncbi:hypothetical protein D3C83_05020 [compost metagenome]
MRVRQRGANAEYHPVDEETPRAQLERLLETKADIEAPHQVKQRPCGRGNIRVIRRRSKISRRGRVLAA